MSLHVVPPGKCLVANLAHGAFLWDVVFSRKGPVGRPIMPVSFGLTGKPLGAEPRSLTCQLFVVYLQVLPRGIALATPFATAPSIPWVRNPILIDLRRRIKAARGSGKGHIFITSTRDTHVVRVCGLEDERAVLYRNRGGWVVCDLKERLIKVWNIILIYSRIRLRKPTGVGIDSGSICLAVRLDRIAGSDIRTDDGMGDIFLRWRKRLNEALSVRVIRRNSRTNHGERGVTWKVSLLALLECKKDVC